MNDQDTLFFSNWEIDQVIKQGTVNVTRPPGSPWDAITLAVDFSDLELTYTPMFAISARVNGQTKWNMQGAGSRVTGYSQGPIFPTADNTKLYIYGGTPGTTYNVRYYIFKKPAIPTP